MKAMIHEMILWDEFGERIVHTNDFDSVCVDTDLFYVF